MKRGRPVLFDSLTAGQTLEEFLDDFEGVSREQAEALLELAGSHLLKTFRNPEDSRFAHLHWQVKNPVSPFIAVGS
jgi:hypothetical protein